ncbi:hypothetical protein FLK61_34215 [Paenalkalicoccus suaedae]|uniref:Fur-regulated basic protein FbpA n=1 Tax=Paenalkalicoccus suaedae TaxID=2592382 RepID=A0A859FGG0_9BACI|nr:hypothetical protein [Paenalkalicoccus suaedae]QKS71681.1 hypothetical protein FLK61_33920 [Paenalkalicoccus suaedae]QKS71734.1 hypothetical protein FLK61_34215 [Paenalkalicoccus suaedae]
MYLSKMVEHKQIVDELHSKGFYYSENGRSLESLKLSELKREQVRLPELREVAENA